MKILFAASECAPLIKVGGLADVVGSLPKALKNIGADVSVVIPFYEAINIDKKELLQKDISVELGGERITFNIRQSQLPGSKVSLLLVENDDYFSGDIYDEGDAYSGKNKKKAEKFLFFSRAVVEIAKIMNFNLIHCHDWHTGIVPFLAKKEGLKTGTLFTIHNIGYQGIFPKQSVNNLLGTDFEEDLNCIKQGILSSDFVSTVSENYAKEILTPEFGFGLEKELSKREDRLIGILNGIDIDYFNPKNDKNIEKNYSLKSLDKKEVNKKSLQKEAFGKADPSACILGIVSRLADQKGFDLIYEIFPQLMEENIQLVLLGAGAKEYEDFFAQKAEENPQKCFVKIGFNEGFARKVYAGSDIFLMPSYFEPCGLGQMIAMRYGAVPLVRATGGLKDTVVEEETGFLFEEYKGDALISCIKKALNVFRDKEKWIKIQTNGMNKDFSWNNSAEKYTQLYQKIITDK